VSRGARPSGQKYRRGAVGARVNGAASPPEAVNPWNLSLVAVTSGTESRSIAAEIRPHMAWRIGLILLFRGIALARALRSCDCQLSPYELLEIVVGFNELFTASENAPSAGRIAPADIVNRLQ